VAQLEKTFDPEAWEGERRRLPEFFRFAFSPPTLRQLLFLRESLDWRRNRSDCMLAALSPPYFDVTNFEEDQWLRLWFLGGPPYPTRGRLSQDDRHAEASKYWTFIADMWRMLGQVLAKNADVVVRLGTGRIAAEKIPALLTACAQFSQRRVSLVSSATSPLKRRQADAFRPAVPVVG